MAEFNDKEKIFHQNLIDAGCKEPLIKKCTVLYEDNKSKEVAEQLCIHRKSLLNELHQVQYKIDCLDFLLNQIRNTKRKGEKR